MLELLNQLREEKDSTWAKIQRIEAGEQVKCILEYRYLHDLHNGLNRTITALEDLYKLELTSQRPD